jgi:hypothetical protein
VSESGGLDGSKLLLQQIDCVRIDSSVQPILPIIQSDHGLVNRKVTRIPLFPRL